MTVGERIRAVRNSLPNKPSQEAFGAKVGLTRDQVNNLERDRASLAPSLSMLMTKVYNLNPEWLSSGQEPMFSVETDENFAAVNEALQLGSENKTRLLRLIADMPEPLLDEMVEYFKDKLKDRP